MEKTIVIHMDEKDIEIPVKASMATLALYWETFNADLIRDLNESHRKLHPDPFAEAIKKVNVNPGQMTQEELTEAILKNVDYTKLNDTNQLPDGDTQMKVLQIFWAMAKTADNAVEKFDKWCDRFEMLPIPGIVDCCHELWTAANTITVELKN